MQTRDIDILARTIYGEARGEFNKVNGGLAALIAVGNVVKNRFEARTWFGKTISEVCQKPFQFSCWNPGDANAEKISQPFITDPVFAICQKIAKQVLNDELPDITKGSNHYFASTMPLAPRWAKGQRPVFTLGNHIFYRI